MTNANTLKQEQRSQSQSEILTTRRLTASRSFTNGVIIRGTRFQNDSSHIRVYVTLSVER